MDGAARQPQGSGLMTRRFVRNSAFPLTRAMIAKAEASAR
jgi:hypothetical protein